MSDSTRKAAKAPNSGGRQHYKGAYRRVIARVRTGRVWSCWRAAAAVGAVALSVFVVVVVMKSIHSQHAQAAARALNHPPATTAVGRNTTPPWAAPTDAAAA